MKRALTWVNLMGVLLLAGLCIVQWQRDRRLHLQIQRLEKVRHEHGQTMLDQEKAVKGLTNDLDRFKVQFQRAHGELAEARARAVKLERENLQLGSDRDQLKASITNWAGAIAERDLRLQQVNEQLRDLSARLRESVLKFNDLASNHHASIHRFNDLATNYNQVVTQLNESRAGVK